MQETDVQVNLIAHAYKNLPAMLFVNLVTAFAASSILSGYSQNIAWAFFSIVLLLTAIRGIKWKQFQQELEHLKLAGVARVTYWHSVYGVLLCLMGVAWALLGCFTILLGVSEIEYPIMIMMSALAAGATGITAPLKKMGKLYIILLLLPVGIAFSLNGTNNYYILAALDFVFLIVMLMTQHKNHLVIKESFTLRDKNTSLINDLQEINNSLEDTIEQRTQQLKDIAYKDSLTGIANRRGLMEWMSLNLSEADSHDAAILFLDLDRFKEINDAKGHEMGDLVLKMAASRFSKCCSNEFMLARWGGDEFVIVTNQDASSHRIATELATTLIESIEQAFDINGEELGLGVSIGSAYYPSDASTFKDAIHAADLAAAEVKRTGRGNLIPFHDRYAEIQKTRFELSRALGIAIANEEVWVEYQPVINAKTGVIDSFEALARWNYAGQPVSPDEFISLAEQTDRIIALGSWVLRVASEEAAKWLAAGHTQKIAVNASVKQLLDDEFVDNLIRTLKQAKLPTGQLKIEVTESLFADEHKKTILNTVKQLRELGIGIQIDDFGTGYSSLSRLHQFPISTIKIDRSFVSEIHSKGHAIIKSTILIARSFNLEVVAEGVETVEQASELYTMGVDYFQGYYFSKPSAELQFESFDLGWEKQSDKA